MIRKRRIRENIYGDLRLHLILLLLFSSSVMFYRLGEGSLAEWDEMVHTQYANVILSNGLNALIDNSMLHYKPPMLPLLTACLYGIFGTSLFASRVLPALSGVGCVLLTYLLARKLFNGWAALLSGIILSTSPEFILYSRMFMLDVPITFFIVLAFVCFTHFKGRRKMLATSAVFLLAFSVRYWIAILIPAILLVKYFIEGKKSARVKMMKYVCAGILGCALVYLLLFAFFRYPLHRFFNDVIIARITGDAGHNYSNAYYPTVLAYGFYPWSVILLPALVYVVVRFYKECDSGELLILVWIVTVMLVFSLFRSKLAWYILPVYPAVSIAVGFFFGGLLSSGGSNAPLAGVGRGVAIVIFILCLSRTLNPPAVLDCSPDFVAVSNYCHSLPSGQAYVSTGFKNTDSWVVANDFRGIPLISMENLTLFIESGKPGYYFMKDSEFDSFPCEYVSGGSVLLRYRDNVFYTSEKYKSSINTNGFSERIKECYPYFPVNIYDKPLIH